MLEEIEEVEEIKEEGEEVVGKEKRGEEKNKLVDEGDGRKKKEETGEIENLTKSISTNSTKEVMDRNDKRCTSKPSKTTKIERIEYERLREEAKAASEYLDHLKRLQAEFINYKKMQEKRNEEMVKFSNELLITDLLPVLDSLDHATNNIHSDKNNINISSLIEGIKLIKKQFLDILSRNGVSEIETIGKVFDPRFHEAISKIFTNNQSENGIIVTEIRKGYLLMNKVIRAAEVCVASFVEEKEEGEKKGGMINNG